MFTMQRVFIHFSVFKKFSLALLSGLFCLCLLLGCTPKENDTLSSKKLKVVATTTLVGDIVQTIADGKIELTTLMHAGVDPHLYKPSAQDVRALTQANIIFYNGLMLEGRMQEIFEKLASRGITTVPVAQFIPRDRLIFSSKQSQHPDPHVWFDPELWLFCVDEVEKALSKKLPQDINFFHQNARSLRETIGSTAAWAHARTQTLPLDKRILITSHDAYNYFGRAFDFQVIGVQGISTATEAGLADIAKTVDFIKKNQIKAIFVESSVSHATIERIYKDADIKLGGELFSDALGTKGKMEIGPDGKSYDISTWSGMMHHNVNTIVEALK